MNIILKDEIIKEYEKRVNNRINTLYDTFYIMQYKNNKYGAILSGEQIALCECLRELEQIINTIIYFLEHGGLQR